MNTVMPRRSVAPPEPQPRWRSVLRHPVPSLLLWLAACVLLPLLLSGCLGGGGDPATPLPAGGV